MDSLFFMAITLPFGLSEVIMDLKREIAKEFNSSHALKSPPHITLHMPFKWKQEKFDQLINVVDDINGNMESFEITLSGFDFFELRVVYVDVIENEKLNALREMVVTQCRQKLKLDNADYKNRPFHPHITIGFRDLRKKDFYLAKNEFETREFESTFVAENISLLKHNGKTWDVIS